MAFYSESQLASIGFRRLGRNVRISDRAAIYGADQMEIGDNSRIDDFCVLSGRITIGRNVHIAVYCNVAGGSEGVALADFAGLAYGCQVFSQSDDYSGATLTNPTVPAAYKREIKKPVLIGRHVIVGTNSIVFLGVTIGEGCSIGAMSMVTKSTDEWTIYFGVPAKPLKPRKRDLLALEQEYLKADAQG